MRGHIVFHDHGVGWGQRFLKRGFRHCFAMVCDSNGNWICWDSMEGKPLVQVVDGETADLLAYWREQGFAVVELEQRALPPRSPFAIANCVGLVKALFCLRYPFAITPYALYRRIR